MYSNQRNFMVAARVLVAAILMMNALDIIGRSLQPGVRDFPLLIANKSRGSDRSSFSPLFAFSFCISPFVFGQRVSIRTKIALPIITVELNLIINQ